MLADISCLLGGIDDLRDDRNHFIHQGEGFAKKIIDSIQGDSAFWEVVKNSLRRDGIANPDCREGLAEEAIKSLRQMEHCL